MELLKKYSSILLFVISFSWALRVLLLPNYPDFQVHYYGAADLIQGQNPYLPDANFFTPQVYPPFDMVFFIPFLVFPYEVAEKVWTSLSILAVLGTLFLIAKHFKVSFFHPLHLFLAALVFLAFPTKFTFGMGQINAVILLFTTLVWYFMQKKEYVKSGIFLSFPVMLKFYPLLVLPYLVWIRKWKILFACIVTSVVLFGTSLFFVPFQIQYMFFTQMLPDLLASWKGDYYNQAFTGVLMRVVEDENLRQVLRVAFALLLTAISFIVIILRKQKSISVLNLEIALLLTLSILINNFSWQHHYIQLVLPFFILVYTIREQKRMYPLYIPIAISYALVAINIVTPASVPVFMQNHVFYGGFILYITNLYLLLKQQK
jgi:alpha-1,2-mannosyltransferase